MAVIGALPGGSGLAQAQRASGQSTESAGPSPKLVHAAHEFEAQMMKELLKPMTEGNALTGDDEGADGVLDSGAGSGGTLGEFATESLGKALSERGGFGIASGIIKQLSHSGNHGNSGKVTKDLHGNTVMRINK
jgi:Rod binding domain-containing protein